MNRFTTARNEFPQPDDYAFLDRFPREHWLTVEGRFHCAVRYIYCTPREVLCYLMRDLDSLTPEVDELRRDYPQQAFETAYQAMRALWENVQRFETEALRYAEHIIRLQIALITACEMGAKSTRLREGGGQP